MNLEDEIKCHPWPYEAMELRIAAARAKVRTMGEMLEVSTLECDLRAHWENRLREWNHAVETARLRDVWGRPIP